MVILGKLVGGIFVVSFLISSASAQQSPAVAAWNALPDVIGADINAGATATQSIAAAQINSGDLFSVDVSGNVAGSQSVTYVFQVGGAAVTGFPVNQPVSGMFSLGTISFVNSVDVVASVAFQITGINSADVFTVDLTNFAASSTPPTVTVVDVGPLQTFSNTGGSHSAFTTANFTTFLGLVGQFRSRAPSYRRSSPEPVGKKVVVIDPKNPMFFSDPELDRWEVFAQGGYGFQDQDQISLDPGYSGDLAAGTVGFSRIVSQNWRLGLGYSFAENDIEVGDIGAADVQGHALHAFSSWTRGGWFADFVYTHGWTDSDLQRYATPTIALSSETEATFHAGTAEFGRLWERGRWVHGPIVGVDYVNGDQDAYQERGNESLGLDLSDAEFESLMTRIGWMIRRPFESRRAIHVPTFEAAWQKDWLRESESLDYSFQSSPVTILQNGQVAGAGQVPSGSLVREAPGEDSLSLRAALTSLFGSRDQWNLTFGYQGQFGRSNYSEHFGSVRLGRLFR